MFAWLRPKEKKLSEMTVKEVMGTVHSKYPGIITRGKYCPPTHQCSRWLLLHGPFYRETDYNCTILVDATQMYDWAVKNSTGVGYSAELRESAKDYLPEWVKDANPSDETVTLLDESMHDALKDWDLDFIIFGWAKVWCSDCRRFTGIFGRAQDEFKRTQNKLKCLSHLPKWSCEEGHILKNEGTEHIRFF